MVSLQKSGEDMCCILVWSLFFFWRMFRAPKYRRILKGEVSSPDNFPFSEPREQNTPMLPRKLVTTQISRSCSHSASFLLQVRENEMANTKSREKKGHVAIQKFVPKRRIKPRVHKDGSNKQHVNPKNQLIIVVPVLGRSLFYT